MVASLNRSFGKICIEYIAVVSYSTGIDSSGYHTRLGKGGVSNHRELMPSDSNDRTHTGT